MKRFGLRHLLAGGPVLATAVVLAGCATQPAPQAPPPVAVVIPPRPMPPMGASPNLVVPALRTDGTRQTVNSDITNMQAVWNLRSAYNVAALNCLGPQYAPIVTSYGAFLKTHAKTLNAANKDMDKRFKADFGKSYIRERETYLTQVYNYFALPPVVPSLCNEVLAMSGEISAVPAGKLEDYAATGLARMNQPFADFFNSYEQYRSDLTAWEARYGTGAASAATSTAAVAGAQPVVGGSAN